MNFGEAVLFSVVAMAIVFISLILLILCVKLFALFKFKDKADVTEDRNFSESDITDDDMLTAGLVAAIEYTNQEKTKDVRIVSIKQIR